MEKNDQRTEYINFAFHPEAIVIGGGDFPKHVVPLQLLHQQERIVCCDGAANQCDVEDIRPWRIVGDGDSLSEETYRKYKQIIRISPDQETNDQTKAIEYLRKKGIHKIAILAATGRREDHTLGNISLLIEYMRKGLETRIYTDNGVFIPCQNESVFKVPLGTAVSVFSFGTKGMCSEGLAYPLYNFQNWWQGTLNHTDADLFRISCTGDYLVYLNYENKKIRE